MSYLIKNETKRTEQGLIEIHEWDVEETFCVCGHHANNHILPESGGCMECHDCLRSGYEAAKVGTTRWVHHTHKRVASLPGD